MDECWNTEDFLHLCWQCWSLLYNILKPLTQFPLVTEYVVVVQSLIFDPFSCSFFLMKMVAENARSGDSFE